jgi:hypothetical protein
LTELQNWSQAVPGFNDFYDHYFHSYSLSSQAREAKGGGKGVCSNYQGMSEKDIYASIQGFVLGNGFGDHLSSTSFF